jgi:hypothetical protein
MYTAFSEHDHTNIQRLKHVRIQSTMSPRSTVVLVLLALFVALATASDAPDTGVDTGNRRMLKLKIEGETKYWAGGADVSANPKV